MSSESCPNFDSCEALLCPADLKEASQVTWFLDEPVCSRRQPPSWVRTQRKVAKKVGKLTEDEIFERGCFSLAMLLHIKAVTKTVQGIPPDHPEQETAWLSAHGAGVSKGLPGDGKRQKLAMTKHPNPGQQSNQSCQAAMAL